MFGNQLGRIETSLLDQFRFLESDIDQLFGRSGPPASIRAVRRGSFPAVNVGSTPERVDVYLFAAGLDPKTLDVTVQQNLLTVSGSRRAATDQQVQYYRRERFEGDFRRVVQLPEDVDPDRVAASYRDGILQVTVERRQSARARHIEIK